MVARCPWIPTAVMVVVLVPLLPACDLELDDDMSDDDTWPEYEGTIDLDSLDVDIQCNEDSGNFFYGDWDIIVFFDGWAAETWVEMWSATYCEGYDSETGAPCEFEGVQRPGWEMDNYDYGWEPSSGFWDSWDLILDFDGETWPPNGDTSYYTCDDVFDFFFCGCDDFDPNDCFCSAPWSN